MNLSFTPLKVLGLITSVVFIWVFLFSIWYSNNILNKEKFIATTTRVIQTEVVRNAISDEVITNVVKKRPIIGAITAPLLSKVLAGVMDTQLFSNVTVRAAQELHMQLTSANPRELTIDLTPAKQIINPLFEKGDSQLIQSIPNKIAILEKNQIPSLYRFGTYLTILGPILFISALIMLGLIWRRIKDKRSYLVILSLIVAASGLMVYFLIPAIGNALIAQASSVNIATIINEVYIAFTSQISQFAINVLMGGLVVAVMAKFIKRDLFRLPQKDSASKTK